MDLQNKLNKTLGLFLKREFKNSRVIVHFPSENNLYRYCVVINGEYLGVKIKSSSSGMVLYNTFLKALGELGENILSIDLGFQTRSGVAGGLLFQNCIDRAKAELIERDSFLMHYRNLIPFKFEKGSEHFTSYILKSRDPDFCVRFIMDPRYLNNSNSCLVFGMGCAHLSDRAFQKAYSEFSSMYLNHRLFGCKNAPLKEPNLWLRKTDFHHNESKSNENKFIFAQLCNVDASDLPRDDRKFDKNLWSVEVLDSPIRFYSFVKVTHPQLEEMEFGTPEPGFNFPNPVFHPFW